MVQRGGYSKLDGYTKSTRIPGTSRTLPRFTETESSYRLIRMRFLYSVAAIVVVIAGLASRRYPGQLPAFLAEFAGDTLWALMLFLLASTLFAGRPVLVRAPISLALAFLVEISHLYHASWIDSIRQTRLGVLVLGFGFLRTDFVCYSVGIAVGSLTEWGIGSFRWPKLEKVSAR